MYVIVKNPTYSHHCQVPAGQEYVFSPKNYVLPIQVLVSIPCPSYLNSFGFKEAVKALHVVNAVVQVKLMTPVLLPIFKALNESYCCGKHEEEQRGCQDGIVNLLAFKISDLIDLMTVLQTSIYLGVVKQANYLYPGMNPTLQSAVTNWGMRLK